jgi:hypothetical protein
VSAKDIYDRFTDYIIFKDVEWVILEAGNFNCVLRFFAPKMGLEASIYS